MRFRSIIDKLTKPLNKNTTAQSDTAMETPRATAPKIPRTPENLALLSTPEAFKLIEEQNNTFMDETNAFMISFQAKVDEVIKQNKEMAAEILRLRAQNNKLRRDMGKLIMLAEMREEDLGEHFDGVPVSETAAKLSRL